MIVLAITLVFRGMDVINFAQGEIFMVGAFLGYVFHVDLGLSIWWPFPLAMVCALVFGSLVELIFMRKLENSYQLSLFMMTVAY